jgi:hypothetical protein
LLAITLAITLQQHGIREHAEDIEQGRTVEVRAVQLYRPAVVTVPNARATVPYASPNTRPSSRWSSGAGRAHLRQADLVNRRIVGSARTAATVTAVTTAEHRSCRTPSCLYPYFMAASSTAGAALPRSSGVITGSTWIVAPSPRKRGSAIAGIWEASFILATMYPPLQPSVSVKYAASGFSSSTID